MKYGLKWGLFFIVLTVILAVSTGYAKQNSKLVRKCCVAGTYTGVNWETLSRTCPTPENGNFKFIINQSRSCGSALWGKVVPVGGSDMGFKGTVSARGGCCFFSGVLTEKDGNTVKIWGTLCWDGTKWVCKDGQFTSATGCSGKFTMSQ